MRLESRIYNTWRVRLNLESLTHSHKASYYCYYYIIGVPRSNSVPHTCSVHKRPKAIIMLIRHDGKAMLSWALPSLVNWSLMHPPWFSSKRYYVSIVTPHAIPIPPDWLVLAIFGYESWPVGSSLTICIDSTLYMQLCIMYFHCDRRLRPIFL
jgi:hypothetical protein